MGPARLLDLLRSSVPHYSPNLPEHLLRYEVPHLPHFLGSSLPSRIASQEVMTADDTLTLLGPVDPPELSSGAARILLEVLLDAVEDFDGESASTVTMTPTPLSQEEARR